MVVTTRYKDLSFVRQRFSLRLFRSFINRTREGDVGRRVVPWDSKSSFARQRVARILRRVTRTIPFLLHPFAFHDRSQLSHRYRGLSRTRDHARGNRGSYPDNGVTTRNTRRRGDSRGRSVYRRDRYYGNGNFLVVLQAVNFAF